MRRSLAPSQRNKPVLTLNDTAKSSSTKKSSDSNNSDEMTIQRLPMFGFLEIPECLNRQFKVPSGCEITEENLALRKVKKLGLPKQFHVIRPGDLSGFRITPKQLQPMQDETIDEEELPTLTENIPPFESLVLWTASDGSAHKIEVIPELASKLRPHQREGVQFLFECTMGLRGFEGEGCILADDMGLGKTLMSITLLWTLLNQGFKANESAIRKVMVVCPTSLVGNWDNELRKWLGDRCPTFAVKTEPKKMIRNFLMHRGKGVLIISYETQRLYHALFDSAKKNMTSIAATSANSFCDMLICDEAHKLKNAESELAKCLSNLPGKKRVLLSGTPMQNELTEFYNMVNFCNPNVLGNLSEFRRRYERPILTSREPGATESEIREAGRLQKELSVIVNEFILKRGNILNAQHLPPKLVQVVCCRLTPLQEALYERLLSSKEIRHIQQGKQTNTLGVIRQLINICSHPQLILDQYNNKLKNKEPIDNDLLAMVELIPTALNAGFGGQMQPQQQQQGQKTKSILMNKGNSSSFIDPNQSGKMTVLHRMMQTMRAINKSERIVIVSNYTSTLDLIEAMCKQNNWPSLRLDGSVNGAKRTKLVEEFNNPMSSSFAFLLSSKAGGCGINLIGGNRLVLFDPDWNPASDKQAAGRIWREGQKRRCFIYRFMSTGTIEEKIIQRQLSKEGLADIVDDKEQINHFSSEELRQLFTLLKQTRSDTHDTLACPRCSFAVHNRQLLQDVADDNADANGSSSKAKKGNKKGKFTQEQITTCVKFLNDFETWLQAESKAFQRRENTRCQVERRILEQLPFHHCLEQMKSQLQAESFDSLTSYSRKQRELFQDIDNLMSKEGLNEIHYRPNVTGDEPPPVAPPQDGVEMPAPQPAAAQPSTAAVHDKGYYYFASGFSVYSQFLRQWTEIVPLLMQLPTRAAAAAAASSSTASANVTNSDDTMAVAPSGEENQNIDQEGCPEEADLNKWSHHCSPLTCDDELFSKALGDDESLVSFIFGLEINWSLLELREEEAKEENERRKLQQIKDLEELNARRLAKKEKQAAKADKGEGESDDEDIVVSSKPKAKREKRKETNDTTAVGDAAAVKKSKKEPSAIPTSSTSTAVAAKKQPVASDLPPPRTVARQPAHDSSSSKMLANPSASSGPDEVDIFFNDDRKKLNSHMSKGKLDLSDFDKFWKTLKVVNNNWRAFFDDTGTEFFAREPGLKAKNMHKFKEGVDYFKMPTGLMRFVIKQYRLAGDDRVAGLLGPMLLQLQQKEVIQGAGAMDIDEAVEELMPIKKSSSSSSSSSKKPSDDKAAKECIDDILGDDLDPNSDKDEDENYFKLSSSIKPVESVNNKHLEMINLCDDSPVINKKKSSALTAAGKKRGNFDLTEDIDDDNETVLDPLHMKLSVISVPWPVKKQQKRTAFHVNSDSDDAAEDTTATKKTMKRVLEENEADGEEQEADLTTKTSSIKEMASKRLKLNPRTQSPSPLLSSTQSTSKKKVQFEELSLGKENSQNQQSSQDDDNGWACPHCTFVNNKFQKRTCFMCDKQRYGSKRIAERELSQL